MSLDILEEPNLNDIINYSLEYPKVVLLEVKNQAVKNNCTSEYAYGLYIGYICGIFFDGFLKRHNRFLNDVEMLEFHSKIFKRSEEIMLKVRSHLKLENT